MKKIAQLLTTLAIVLAPVSLGGGVAAAASVNPLGQLAASSKEAACEGAGGSVNGASCDIGDNRTVNDILGSVIKFLSYLAGAISIIMIIVAGIRYVVSGGDSNSIAGAKNTLIYAIVGLVIAVLAQAIVRFAFTKATS